MKCCNVMSLYNSDCIYSSSSFFRVLFSFLSWYRTCVTMMFQIKWHVTLAFCLPFFIWYFSYFSRPDGPTFKCSNGKETTRDRKRKWSFHDENDQSVMWCCCPLSCNWMWMSIYWIKNEETLSPPSARSAPLECLYPSKFRNQCPLSLYKMHKNSSQTNMDPEKENNIIQL